MRVEIIPVFIAAFTFVKAEFDCRNVPRVPLNAVSYFANFKVFF